MAGTSVSLKGFINGAGGRVEFWQFVLDIASIAADAQGTETVTIPGARAGDQVFFNCDAPNKHIVPQGAKVTANNTVSLYFGDNWTATTAVDNASQNINLLILKQAVPGTIP